jgi:hypothetical protein
LSGARGDKIERIDLRVEDSLKNGVLIGAGIGASVGLLACYSVDEGCGARVGAEAILWYGGAGAGLGALFDALFHDRRPIYVAPGSATESKIQLGLIVTRERKGLFVSWSF